MLWSEEQRQREAERIRQRKPWLKSTGPRTAAGKAISSRNAFKGGRRRALREIAKMIKRLASPNSDDISSEE